MSTQWLGGGTLPTQQLQDALCGDPCARSIPARWYDGGLTLVYYTHFIAAPLTALVLYLRNRLTWVAFMRRYIALYLAGASVLHHLPDGAAVDGLARRLHRWQPGDPG